MTSFQIVICELIECIKILLYCNGIFATLENKDSEKFEKCVNEVLSILQLLTTDFKSFMDWIEMKVMNIHNNYLFSARKYMKLRMELCKLKEQEPTITWLKKKIQQEVDVNYMRTKILEHEQEVNFELGTKLTKTQHQAIIDQNLFLFHNTFNDFDSTLAYNSMKDAQFEEASIQTMKFLRSWIVEFEKKTTEMSELYDSKSESYETKIQRWTNDLRSFKEIREAEKKVFQEKENEVQEYYSKKILMEELRDQN